MAEEQRQIRAAADILFNASINSQRSSCTQYSVTRTPEFVLSEDIIAGARHNGKMSNVRRFFCLFVTFDLLLTFLIWLICIVIAGENIRTIFVDQVVHYHIKTSLFDIVMAAICRFTVLLLFYALLYLNHWTIVALSTASTCAFLIAKVFLFDWSACSQPVFQVLLIVTSFILAWAEAWFFDFRVVPQETHARNWIRGEPEREPLLRGVTTDSRQYASNVEPTDTFFHTPVESPNLSDNEEDQSRRESDSRRLSRSGDFSISRPLPKLTSEKIEEYKTQASTLLKGCHDLLTSKDWKFEYETTGGDKVLSMQRPKPEGKIVRIVGVVDVPASKLVDRLFEDVEASPKWNKLVAESSKLQQIDENTDIVYQATSPQGGGIIDPRDFIILRHRNKCGDFYISSGVSVRLASLPNRKHVIRGENGISCWAAEDIPGDENKCRFTWILNTNLKGWIPQKIVDRSLSTALVDFMSYLRKHADENWKISE